MGALTFLVQDLMDALYGLDARRACQLYENLENRVSWTERSEDPETDTILLALRMLEPTRAAREPVAGPYARSPFVRAAR
jgi:hypothetical protein